MDNNVNADVTQREYSNIKCITSAFNNKHKNLSLK